MSASKRNPHVAIMVAAAVGKGLRLTPDEVWLLAQDDAVRQRAVSRLTPDAFGRGWHAIDPRRDAPQEPSR